MRPRGKEHDAQAISHHYDVSNEFYQQFGGSVPEPMTLSLMGAGLLGLGLLKRRK